jgi:tRNA pseudouridine55 synthase
MNNSVEGIVLIDKPRGPSSFDVVKRVRKLAGIKRVGHAGTLDPDASGLMVVCLGRYTKLAGLLIDDDKVYQTSFRFGISTTTDDAEGKVIAERDCSYLQAEDIICALKNMHGEIMQTPPRYSAIKVDGQRAYQKARDDEAFELKQRAVKILAIANVIISLPAISLRLHCSKGFYVRSFARDLGEMLGVGAHATSIRRLSSGRFSLDQAIGLYDLIPENFSTHLLSGTKALSSLETFLIDDAALSQFKFGRNGCADMPMQSPVAIAIHGDDPVAILRNVGNKAMLARVI